MSFKANDSLTEQIAQYLGKQIIEGGMKPGERIQELRIAAELSVSRGSVREALLILQRRHLVEIYPRRGAVVASISADDVGDFFDIWFMMLDKVVRSLASNWKNDDLARFFELMTELSDCQRRDDRQGFYEHGVEFLRNLYSYANNRYVEQTLDDLLPLTQRCLFAILRAGRAQLDRTHAFLEEVLKTIIARDTQRLTLMLDEFSVGYTQLAQESAEALTGRA